MLIRRPNSMIESPGVQFYAMNADSKRTET